MCFLISGKEEKILFFFKLTDFLRGVYLKLCIMASSRVSLTLLHSAVGSKNTTFLSIKAKYKYHKLFVLVTIA